MSLDATNIRRVFPAYSFRCRSAYSRRHRRHIRWPFLSQMPEGLSYVQLSHRTASGLFFV